MARIANVATLGSLADYFVLSDTAAAMTSIRSTPPHIFWSRECFGEANPASYYKHPRVVRQVNEALTADLILLLCHQQ